MQYNVALEYKSKYTVHKLTIAEKKTATSKIKSNYFIVRLKVDQRAGQLSLPHLGITKTEKMELKHKTDEQISSVNGLEP